MEAFAIDLGLLGWITRSAPFVVTADQVSAYAAATNDLRAREADDGGAPFAFAIVPVFGLLAETAMNMVDDFEAARFLHGQHVVTQHRRLRVGDTVVGECSIVGIQDTPAGALVVTRITSRDVDGQILNEQMASTLVRSHRAVESMGERFPRPARHVDLSNGRMVSQTFDDDQTFRYSRASGDDALIHLDDAVARAAGLPGIIIHGLCTFAFAARAAVEALCPDNPARLQSVSCRFASPVRPGQTMVTSFGGGEGAGHAFESQVGDGVVLKEGWVRVGER